VILCFPALPGSAEAQVIWGHSKASFDCVLYCNISAKKHQNRSHVSKL